MTKKFQNKLVNKKNVDDLRKSLKDLDGGKDIILAFYYKGKVHHVYLAEIMTDLKYDGVIKETLESSSVVELTGFDDDFCKYGEEK